MTRHYHFDVHGVGLRVTTADSSVGEILADRLYPYVRDSLGSVAFKLKVDPATEQTAKDIANVATELRWQRSRPLWGEVQGDMLRFTDGASLAIVDYASGRAALQIQPETAADAHFFARTFLLLPVIELLRTEAFYYLHGALIAKADQSILILGAGGSGKSTLCAAMMLQGWTVIADDNLLLAAGENDSVTIYPLEQELSLAAVAVRQLSASLDLDDLETPESGKARIRLDRLRDGLHCAATKRPTELWLLSPAAIAGVQPLARSDAFGVMAGDNPMILAHPTLSRQHALTLRNLLRGVTCRIYTPPWNAPLNLLALGKRARADLLAADPHL